MVAVRGRLDRRCLYGTPWRIDQGPAVAGEIPYHVVLSGSAVLEDPAGGPPRRLMAGDILLLPTNPAHVLHDSSRTSPIPAQAHPRANLTVSEKFVRLARACGGMRATFLPPRLTQGGA
jgi:AraC family transcriptional activator of mtrCDE